MVKFDISNVKCPLKFFEKKNMRKLSEHECEHECALYLRKQLIPMDCN